MNEKSITELITEISQKTSKSEEEISKLIKAKVEKFSGLLTEQGAAYMVQKELGLKQESYEQMPIGKLTEGMKGIEVKGKVEAVFPTKEFDKNGKKGKLKSFILSDGTGEVRGTLWNDQVELYNLTRGSEIAITNVLVSKYNEKAQITLGYNGVINVLNKKEEEFEKIAQLKSGLNNVNVIGRIVRKFPAREFESNDRKGKVCSFQIGDESAIIRTSAWNDKAEEMEKYNEGDAIEITNAYTKEGRFGAELHLGYTAQISETKKEIAALGEVLKEKMQEKQITQLMEGENATINTKILSVERGNFLYEVCEKCGKKITRTENGVLCEKCGETNTKKNAVISLIVKDESGEIRANFFGKNALKALGMEQAELEKALNEKTSDVFLAELNGKMEGKAMKIYGYERISPFSGNKEFSAREVL